MGSTGNGGHSLQGIGWDADIQIIFSLWGSPDVRKKAYIRESEP